MGGLCVLIRLYTCPFTQFHSLSRQYLPPLSVSICHFVCLSFSSSFLLSETGVKRSCVTGMRDRAEPRVEAERRATQPRDGRRGNAVSGSSPLLMYMQSPKPIKGNAFICKVKWIYRSQTLRRNRGSVPPEHVCAVLRKEARRPPSVSLRGRPSRPVLNVLSCMDYSGQSHGTYDDNNTNTINDINNTTKPTNATGRVTKSAR